MTFTELVNEVMARTRQTTPEAQTRIGREVNDRNRRVTTTVGLEASRRGGQNANMLAGDEQANFLQLVKLELVYTLDGGTRRVLQEITYNQWRAARVASATSGPPTRYAIAAIGAGAPGVRIVVDPVPASPITLYGEGTQTIVDLAGSTPPGFPADFHDILMHGALADEWLQLKQDDLAARSEAMYEQRLGELRYFIAKSAYLDIYQGKRSPTPYWPFYPYYRGY